MRISTPPNHVLHVMSNGSLGAPETGLPESLSNALLELEQWALKNQKKADRNAIAFWCLKGPAIAASGSLVIWDHFGLDGVGTVAGAIAAILVAFDGLNPRGMLRNAYVGAVLDIRNLEMKMINKWRVKPDGDTSNYLREIIQDSQVERERISKRLREMETGMQAYSDKASIEAVSAPRRPGGRRRGADA